MRQQNKALIITRYSGNSLCMCCFNTNVMHVHALTGVRSFTRGQVYGYMFGEVTVLSAQGSPESLNHLSLAVPELISEKSLRQQIEDT